LASARLTLLAMDPALWIFPIVVAALIVGVTVLYRANGTRAAA